MTWLLASVLKLVVHTKHNYPWSHTLLERERPNLYIGSIIYMLANIVHLPPLKVYQHLKSENGLLDEFRWDGTRLPPLRRPCYHLSSDLRWHIYLLVACEGGLSALLLVPARTDHGMSHFTIDLSFVNWSCIRMCLMEIVTLWILILIFFSLMCRLIWRFLISLYLSIL